MSPALVNGHNGGTTSPGMFSSTQRRGPIAAEFQGPGPAAVSLPSTIGKFKHTISISLRLSKRYKRLARHSDRLMTVSLIAIKIYALHKVVIVCFVSWWCFKTSHATIYYRCVCVCGEEAERVLQAWATDESRNTQHTIALSLSLSLSS